MATVRLLRAVPEKGRSPLSFCVRVVHLLARLAYTHAHSGTCTNARTLCRASTGTVPLPAAPVGRPSLQAAFITICTLRPSTLRIADATPSKKKGSRKSVTESGFLID